MNAVHGQDDGGRRLLFLNNTSALDAVPPTLRHLAADTVSVDSFWCSRNEFPDSLTPYAGCVVSGSAKSSYDDDAWIARQHALIRRLTDRGTPVLGICFGSQIAASALFGRDWVFRRDCCEVGFKTLHVSPEARRDPVCDRLDPSTRMFVWHNDDVRPDHPDMRVLATTDACPNQIWRHRERRIWGVQGHLEITVAEAPAWFGRNRDRLEADGADVDRLIAKAEEAESAKSILRRFLNICSDDDCAALTGRSGVAGPVTV